MAFDWNQARAFLATAEEGSFSAAAKALGQTQPTIGRQVAALEEALGVALFEHAGRSIVLTQSGLDLLDHFKAMGEAATQLSLAASGRSQAIKGHVSITSTNMMATFHLPKIFTRIRKEAPAITLEIIASNDVRDLTQREADISIRHARPQQDVLVGRLLGETEAHLYASTDYLNRIGRPQTAEDLANADFIGWETADTLVPFLQGMGIAATRDNFKIITASGNVAYALLQEGLGFGFLPTQDAVHLKNIERVVPSLPPVPIPVWLVTHRELKTSRRIRLVFDIIAEELSKNL